MEETVSGQDDYNLRQSDIVSEWLGESHFIGLIVGELSECLSMLARKRSTLEEKIIAKQLHSLVAVYGAILGCIHSALSDGKDLQEENLEQLRSFDYHVRVETEKLLKAMRHNLNYVEQYFEYDFSAKLSHEWKFAETARHLLDELQK